MKRLFAVLLLALGLAGLARADQVEVIELKYRTAEQLIPTLSPLVEPGGGLTGRQNMLVIRASRANIAQLKQVVANLDTMPRRLMISVRQDAAGSFVQRGAGVSGTVSSGDVRVGVNEAPRPQSGVSAGMYDSRGTADDRFGKTTPFQTQIKITPMACVWLGCPAPHRHAACHALLRGAC